MKIKAYSIKTKFLLSFIFIFLFTTIILNLFITSLLEKSYSNKIQKDFDSLYKSSRDYIYQYSSLKGITLDETNIVYQAQNIINILNTINPAYLSILDKNLKELAEDNKTIDRRYIVTSDDLISAKDNKASVTIKNLNGKYIASFSYGLFFDKKLIAIINFKNDYTYLYEERDNMMLHINLIMITMLILSIGVTFYLTTRITNPLYKLISAVDKFAAGSYNKINVKSNDEVGILASKFNIMQDTIKENLETIKDIEKYRREFFNNVTHELKTPLTGIKLYAELLEEDFDNPSFVSDAAVRIKSESKRLYDLVEHLLEVSKGTTSQATESANIINVKPIAEAIIKDITLLADKKEMKIISSLEDSTVKAYNNYLIQIIINILDNAVKYGAPESSIHVDIFDRDNYCNIHVRNTISTLDNNSQSGNGLGLFIVDSILNKMGGNFTIENNKESFKIKIQLPSL